MNATNITDDDSCFAGSSMEIRKCRILISPVYPEKYGREPEYWYYEAPEAYADVVGRGLLYWEKWTSKGTFDNIQVWDPKKRRWGRAVL